MFFTLSPGCSIRTTETDRLQVTTLFSFWVTYKPYTRHIVDKFLVSSTAILGYENRFLKLTRGCTLVQKTECDVLFPRSRSAVMLKTETK